MKYKYSDKLVVTASHMGKYRDMLARISNKAAEELQDYMLKNGFQIDEAFLDFATSLAEKYGEASGALAAQFYDDLEEYWEYVSSGGSFDAYAYSGKKTAEIASVPTQEEVADAFSGKSEQQIIEEMQRLVKQTAEDTTLKNAIRDGAYYAWVPSGDTCPYCLMIASNGWRRASDKVLKGGHASHIHANCDCTFVVRFSDDMDVEGYHPEKIFDTIMAADGNSIYDKLNTMRRENYQENKEDINARKRELYAMAKLKEEDEAVPIEGTVRNTRITKAV